MEEPSGGNAPLMQCIYHLQHGGQLALGAVASTLGPSLLLLLGTFDAGTTSQKQLKTCLLGRLLTSNIMVVLCLMYCKYFLFI